MHAVAGRSPTVASGLRTVKSCSRVESADSLVARSGSVVARFGSVVARFGSVVASHGCPVPVVADPVPVIAGLARSLGRTVIIAVSPIVMTDHEAMMPHLAHQSGDPTPRSVASESPGALPAALVVLPPCIPNSRGACLAREYGWWHAQHHRCHGSPRWRGGASLSRRGRRLSSSPRWAGRLGAYWRRGPRDARFSVGSGNGMNMKASPITCPACRVIDREDGNLYKIEH